MDVRMFVNSNVRNAYIWVLGQNATTSPRLLWASLKDDTR